MVTFRYFRMRIIYEKGVSGLPSTTLPSTYGTQFADLEVYNGASRIDYSSASATQSDTTTNPVGQGPSVGIDNNISTVWYAFCTNLQPPGATYIDYTIDFGQNVTADNYFYYTGGDLPERDPVTWEIYLSLDGTNYYLNSSVSNATITDSRQTATQTFNLASALCYNEGTQILCIKDEVEQYINIENLKKGDLVKTYLHGYKQVELIGKKYIFNNPNNPLECMYIHTNNNLIVSGGHFILVDNIDDKYKNKQFYRKKKHKIEDKLMFLCSDSEFFKPIINNNVYTVYHLVLEGGIRYGIYVNDGILSESTSRDIFEKKEFEIL